MSYFLLVAGYLLLNYFIITESRSLLDLAGIHHSSLRRTLLGIYLAAGILPIAGAFLPDSSLKFRLQALGNLWLGILTYGGMLLLVLVIANAVMARRKQVMSSGAARIVLCAVLAGTVGINIYGSFHAQDVKTVSYEVQVDKAAGVKDLKIVLLADLHMSVNTHIETIRRMVAETNAENPDVILIAGDFFTSSYSGLQNPQEYEEALSGLKAAYGVYGVYGNHDVAETLFGGFPVSPIEDAVRPQEMVDFMEKSGIQMLMDQTITLGDTGIQVAGRIDGERAGDGTDHRLSAEELLQADDASRPLIVLEHEPWEFSKLSAGGADLVLCGHTHAGQIFPGSLIVPFFNENGYGMKNTSGITSIVTAGVGYYGPPLRVGTDSEITVVQVHFKN